MSVFAELPLTLFTLKPTVMKEWLGLLVTHERLTFITLPSTAFSSSAGMLPMISLAMPLGGYTSNHCLVFHLSTVLARAIH